MGFYCRVILPWFLDWAMDREALNRIRQDVLSEANGEVLEIGFGTGVNLPYYPSVVKKITTVDPNPGMSLRAHKLIEASPLPVDLRIATAETLPMPNDTFDTAVSTLTLCSIPDGSRTQRSLSRSEAWRPLSVLRAWFEPRSKSPSLARPADARLQNSRRRMPFEPGYPKSRGGPPVRYPASHQLLS